MTLFRSNGSGTFISESRRQLGTGWSAMNSISPARGFTASGSTGLLARDTTGALSYYPLATGVLGAKKALATGWNTILIAGSATIIRQQPLSGPSDIVRVDAAGKLWAHPANGAGGLNASYQIGTGWSTAKALHVLDWNKDGVPDVLAQWSSGALSVYFGAKTGGFTGPVALASTGFAQTTLVTGRWVKASSYPGLVGYGADGVLYYWANASGRALSAPVKIGVSWGGLKIAMTDFDSDGNQDLLAVNSLGAMRLYRSNGQSGFISETRKTVGSSWQYFRQFSSTARLCGRRHQGCHGTPDGRPAGLLPHRRGKHVGHPHHSRNRADVERGLHGDIRLLGRPRLPAAGPVLHGNSVWRGKQEAVQVGFPTWTASFFISRSASP